MKWVVEILDKSSDKDEDFSEYSSVQSVMSNEKST